MRRRKRTRKLKVSKGKIFALVLFVIGVAVTVAAQMLTSTGFQAQAIQKQIDKLAEENKHLEFQATALQSLQTLTNSVYQDQDMVKVQDLRHIVPAKQADQKQRASLTNTP